MKQYNNIVMTGASGSLGKQLVFRQRAGKTVISMPPAKIETAPSASQLKLRNKFAAAIRYARLVLANPALKAAYQAKAMPGVSAYNTAISDYLKAPEIISADAAAYTGLPGDKISIHATDDFRVQQVYLTIQGADGSILEEGTAVAGTVVG